MERERQTRNSAQRKLVLELMSGNRSHPTADEVYELARKSYPHISRGTVYRNLNLLAQAGEIRRITMPQGADHYDSTVKNHYHFFCRRCERVFDVSMAYNEALNSAQEGMEDFKIEWHRVLFAGLCPQCNNKSGGMKDD